MKALIPPAGSDLYSIDPHNYFITSGDAVQKTEQLIRDIKSLMYKVQQATQEGNKPELKEFYADCSSVMDGCIRMKKNLEYARGKDVFLETEWEHSCLLCIPKNPRLKK